MPTTVTSTIGTSGTYSTPQAWEDDCPANLVAEDKIWRGELKNQEFSGSGTRLNISGQTTDSTRYVEITTEAGASFRDHANKLTNALKYNASVGAGLRNTASYSEAVIVNNAAYTRISNIQVMAEAAATLGISCSASGTNMTCENVISHARRSTAIFAVGVSTLRNTLAIVVDNSYGSASAIRNQTGTMTCYNCTATGTNYSPGSGNSAAFRNYYGGLVLKNCAAFGFFNTFWAQNIGATSSHNASDKTWSAGSNNISNLVFADQFESNVYTALDFRLKAGSGMIDMGTDLSGSGVTTDIVGSSRGATYDIGAWEIAVTVHDLIANAIVTGSPVVGTPAITQTHLLSTTALVTGAPVVGNPTIAQAHLLAATALTTGAPTVGSPLFGQVYIFTANGIIIGPPVLGNPILDAPAPTPSLTRWIDLPARSRIVVLASRDRSITLPLRDRPVSLPSERF